ncbi:uncharacterized protein LOC134240013 [Saccostrea cucullata]|uniref:uncharacterized protein LOC134240013 n=1 Tax=Saccostrea cuccullata TaxID=36930 RepID=UPI002ED47B30
MESQGVIGKVDEPTKWVSSIVCAEKSNGKLRICLDKRDFNKAIKREFYQLPTIEEITTRLAGAKVFRKLDSNIGYWQIPLDSESQKLRAARLKQTVKSLKDEALQGMDKEKLLKVMTPDYLSSEESEMDEDGEVKHFVDQLEEARVQRLTPQHKRQMKKRVVLDIPSKRLKTVPDFAVVVVDSGGKHRFSYTGPPSGSGLRQGFNPSAICTDALSHILVVDTLTDTVQMIDKDGNFLSLLLTKPRSIHIKRYGLTYDYKTHLLYVGSGPSKLTDIVSVYRYIERQNYSLIDT